MITALDPANGSQGNRVKNSSCDETCEEVVVPSGDFAFESEAIFAGGFSDQIEGHVSQRGEIGGGVVASDTAFVVAEYHVHHPVEAVFARPVAADDRPQLDRQPGQGGDVKARLALDFVSAFAHAL